MHNKTLFPARFTYTSSTIWVISCNPLPRGPVLTTSVRAKEKHPPRCLTIIINCPASIFQNILNGNLSVFLQYSYAFVHASSVASRRKRQSRGKNPTLFANSSVMSIAFKMSAGFMMAIVRIMAAGFIGIPLSLLCLYADQSSTATFPLSHVPALGKTDSNAIFSLIVPFLSKNSSYLLQFIIIQNRVHSNFLHSKKKDIMAPIVQ